MSVDQPVCLWPVGAELGEGPLWHAASNSVYFVDIRGRAVHRCAPDGSQRQSWNAPGRPGFIVPVSGGKGVDASAAAAAAPAATTVAPAATTVAPAQAGAQVGSAAADGSENLGSRLRGNDGENLGSRLRGNDGAVGDGGNSGSGLRWNDNNASGGFVVGLDDGLYRFNERSGEFSSLRKVEADMPGNRFNDGFVAADGALWFGSMDAGESEPTGSLYRIDHTGEPRKADSGYIITNGPAMSPDGATLYHTDTLDKKVYAFDVLPGGTVARKRLFVATLGPGHPDGMAVDAGGDVWVAMFGGARIDRYNPAGELIGTIGFPCSNITKLAFGDDDLRTAFVSTAWKGLAPEQRAREPLAGGLFAFRTDTPGLAQHEFLIRDFA